MANNPYVNKVVYGNSTVLDLTSDTVTANDVKSGVTFHDATGASQTGQYSPPIVTDITPKDYSAVSMTADNAYKPNSNSYAIRSYTSVTPGNSPINLATDRFYLVNEPISQPYTAYLIKRYSDITPSDSSPVSLANGSMYKMGGGGYAIESSPTSLTPADSTNPPSIASGTIYKGGGSGYAVVTKPSALAPNDSAPAAISNGGMYLASGGGCAIQSYQAKTPDDSDPPLLNADHFYKPTTDGYLYATQQGGGSSHIIDLFADGALSNATQAVIRNYPSSSTGASILNNKITISFSQIRSGYYVQYCFRCNDDIVTANGLYVFRIDSVTSGITSNASIYVWASSTAPSGSTLPSGAVMVAGTGNKPAASSSARYFGISVVGSGSASGAQKLTCDYIGYVP